MSLSGRGLSYSRGASVLAALVLVGILGVAYVAFQYAQSSFHLAEGTPVTLTAAIAIATPSAGSFVGCMKNNDPRDRNYGKLQCQCAQPARSPKAVSGSLSTVQNCLPGCVYDVHPGTPSLDGNTFSNPAPKIVTESSRTVSDWFTPPPDSSQCTVKVCTSSDASSCVLAGNKSSTLPSGGTGTGASPGYDGSCASGEVLVAGSCVPSTPQTPSAAGNAGQDSAINNALGGCGTDSFNPCTNPPTNVDGTGAPNQSTSLGGCVTDSFNPCPPTSSTPNPAPGVVQNPDLSSGVSGSNSPNPCASNEVTINGTCQEAPPGVSTSCASGEVLVAGNCQPSQPGISTSCASGEVLVAGNCKPSPTTFTQSPPPNNNNNNNNNNSNNNSVGDISQFFQGLMKGLTGGKGGGGGGSGQQQQQNAPYGRGTDGAACYQPPVKPDPSACSVGTWKSTSSTGNGCVTGWQCVPSAPSAAGQPTATLSCQPQTADVGMTISFSYACTNATGSAGSGFNTSNALSGSTTTVIGMPPAGANTASYGVTCINGTQTASQQCSIQINKPWISLVAIPSVVAKNGSSAIGWVTGGMQSCALSIMNASATSSNPTAVDVSGVNTIFSIATTTSVSLVCQTLSGGMSQATSTIIIQ